MQGSVPSLGTLVGCSVGGGRLSLRHSPPPGHRHCPFSRVPNLAFRRWQTHGNRRFPTGMVQRCPLHHSATALARTSRSPHGKLSVGLYEMFEERLRGVSKGDVYVDDIQLPR